MENNKIDPKLDPKVQLGAAIITLVILAGVFFALGFLTAKYL
jgi:preprotein translocase subunit Sec61beta